MRAGWLVMRVNSVLRVIDLITGGVRDYEVAIAGGIGVIERVAWSPDNAFLYSVNELETERANLARPRVDGPRSARDRAQSPTADRGVRS